MVGVLGQHRHQLPTSEDQRSVQPLPPNRTHPPLRIGVRTRCPHRCAQHLDRLGGKDRVKRGGELGIPITNQVPQPAEIVAELHEEVPGLLDHPLPHRMRCHREHVDPAGRPLKGAQTRTSPVSCRFALDSVGSVRPLSNLRRPPGCCRTLPTQARSVVGSQAARADRCGPIWSAASSAQPKVTWAANDTRQRAWSTASASVGQWRCRAYLGGLSVATRTERPTAQLEHADRPLGIRQANAGCTCPGRCRRAWGDQRGPGGSAPCRQRPLVPGAAALSA